MLKADRGLMLEIMRQNGDVPDQSPREHKADRESMFEAVKKNGYALTYVAPKLRPTRESCLKP